MNPDGPVPEPVLLITRREMVDNILKELDAYPLLEHPHELAERAIDILEETGVVVPWGMDEEGNALYATRSTGGVYLVL